MKRKLIFRILTLFLLLNSCSPNELELLSIHCLCVVDEHFGASTNSEDNSIKKYTFTDSRLLDRGVPINDYALGAAMFIYPSLDTTRYQQLKLNFVNNGKAEKSYTFLKKDLLKYWPMYAQIESTVNEFIADIYDHNDTGCYSKTITDISEDEFSNVLNKVRQDLYEDYKTTEIASYKIDKTEYHIYGAILNPENKTYLFKMSLKEVKGELKIISFEF